MEATLNNALVSYPPAPQNGGAIDLAPDKIGDWVWQPKIDDWRGVINTATGQIWNQYGQPSTVAMQGKITIAFAELQQMAAEMPLSFGSPKLWDVGIMENRHDLMRGCIVIFDLMDTVYPHKLRRTILEQAIPRSLPIAHRLLQNGQVKNEVFLINEWRSGEFSTPLGLQMLLQRENALVGHKFYEGLVAKRRDVTYPAKSAPKQKTPYWIKHRFDQ
jgi:hypothetical protein